PNANCFPPGGRGARGAAGGRVGRRRRHMERIERRSHSKRAGLPWLAGAGSWPAPGSLLAAEGLIALSGASCCGLRRSEAKADEA
ncbi:hypothetical protein P7K49_001630, partial [Saguinus oedipus]